MKNDAIQTRSRTIARTVSAVGNLRRRSGARRGPSPRFPTCAPPVSRLLGRARRRASTRSRYIARPTYAMQEPDPGCTPAGHRRDTLDRRLRSRRMAPDTSPVPTLNARQAAFIGVGAMVGAGIFSLLGAAGEVAGCGRVALVPDRRRRWRCCRATRSRSSGRGIRRPVASSSTSSRASATGHVAGDRRVARLSPRTRSSPRWSRCRSAATPAPPSPTAARLGSRSSRSLIIIVMSAAQRRRARRPSRGSRPWSSSWSSGILAVFAVVDDREHGPAPARLLRLPVAARHRRRASP